MLNLILAESALEIIPKQLWQHPQIRKYAEKRGKLPDFLVLDRSYHHAAMKQLVDDEKRGRPDIVHFSLLEGLGSPLNKEGQLQIFIHTIADNVILVNQKTRLPRNYNRFIGLMEQLFEFKQIPPKDAPLLVLRESMKLPQLIDDIKSDYTIAFSRKGAPETLEQAISELAKKKRPLVIVGGFPHGTFSKTVTELSDEVVSIDCEMLEAWTVTSRAIYEYERATSLPAKRL